VAQAFIFIFAGYETSASAMGFALYELALHPEIQQTLRAEILQVLSGQGGKLTYDSVKGMSYLDRVVSGEQQNRLNNNLILTDRGIKR
jgi:cytochrome P450 family 6